MLIRSFLSSLIGIGITARSVRAIGMPGWHPRSYAYHGDDGNKFIENSSGEDYGPTYGMGDVVGCGLDLANSSVFFTKNGKKLGEYQPVLSTERAHAYRNSLWQIRQRLM